MVFGSTEDSGPQNKKSKIWKL